jgi:hypothetical protein
MLWGLVILLAGIRPVATSPPAIDDSHRRSASSIFFAYAFSECLVSDSSMPRGAGCNRSDSSRCAVFAAPIPRTAKRCLLTRKREMVRSTP